MLISTDKGSKYIQKIMSRKDTKLLHKIPELADFVQLSFYSSECDENKGENLHLFYQHGLNG